MSEQHHQQELEEREQMEEIRTRLDRQNNAPERLEVKANESHLHPAPPLNVHQRLHAAMLEVKYVQKDKPSGLKYSIVSHDKVTAAVRPALMNQGIVYYPVNLNHSQDGNRTIASLDLRFVNIDNPEDFIDVASFGYGLDSQDKGPGKAISYSVKYGLLKAMGLETGDDPDLDQKTEYKKTAPDGSEVPTLDEALKAHSGSIKTIIDALNEGDLSVASESWNELTMGEQMSLWVAPSKGGPFSTEQRRTMKTMEFIEANGE